MQALPSKSLGLHLSNAEVVTGVKLRRGMEVYDMEDPCLACGVRSDKLGVHSLGCGMRSERIAWHDSLRNVLFATAKQAGLNPRMEERSLLPQEGREFKRPGNIVIPNWDRPSWWCSHH